MNSIGERHKINKHLETLPYIRHFCHFILRVSTNLSKTWKLKIINGSIPTIFDYPYNVNEIGMTTVQKPNKSVAKKDVKQCYKR